MSLLGRVSRRRRIIPLVALIVAAVATVAVHGVRKPDGKLRRHTVSEIARPNHDFLVTRVAAPASPLPLRRVRLLTPRLVLLAAAKADRFWGGTRCQGITFDFKSLGDARIAEATWEAFVGSTEYLNCHITFNTNPTKIRTTFWHYCGAVVHEYGHLAGRGHTDDPTRIMFPELSNQNVPATCKQFSYP